MGATLCGATANQPEHPALTVIVEGEIAAGKTEIVKALVTKINALNGAGLCSYKAVAVFEPVKKWENIGILKKFYANPVQYGYSFQTYVYVTQIQAIQEVYQGVNPSELAKTVFILERSPISDEIFMELQRGIVTDTEMDMYDSWRRTFEKLIPLDLSRAHVYYLKPSLDTCMQRLKNRNRDGEIVAAAIAAELNTIETVVVKKASGVSKEYQERLRRAHEALLQGLHGDEFPVLVARVPPYPRESVVVVPESMAELNFRDPGPEQDKIINSILEGLQLLKAH